jgi:hypothetical protein
MSKISPAIAHETHEGISDAELRLWPAEEQQEPDAASIRAIPLSPGLTTTLKGLGMTEAALTSWEAMDLSVAQALCYCFGSLVVLVSCIAYLLFAGVPLTRYIHSIPCITTLLIVIGLFASLWRNGPPAAKHPLYLTALPCGAVSGAVAFVVSFLGPLEDYPFESYLHFLIVTAIPVFSGNLWLKSGGFFTEHPPEPRTSMVKPLLQSAIITARCLDNLTDISTIRIVMVEVCCQACWLIAAAMEEVGNECNSLWKVVGHALSHNNF